MSSQELDRLILERVCRWLRFYPYGGKATVDVTKKGDEFPLKVTAIFTRYRVQIFKFDFLVDRAAAEKLFELEHVTARSA